MRQNKMQRLITSNILLHAHQANIVLNDIKW